MKPHPPPKSLSGKTTPARAPMAAGTKAPQSKQKSKGENATRQKIASPSADVMSDENKWLAEGDLEEVPDDLVDERVEELLQQDVSNRLKSSKVLTVRMVLELQVSEEFAASASDTDRTAACKAFTHLRLDRCNLGEVPEQVLSVFEGATNLYLQHNRIKSLVGFSTLKNLRFLMVANNNLETLAGVEQLSKLLFLDVSNNQIKDFSSQALPLDLRFLNIAGNPACQIPICRRNIIRLAPALRHLDGLIHKAEKLAAGLTCTSDDEDSSSTSDSGSVGSIDNEVTPGEEVAINHRSISRADEDAAAATQRIIGALEDLEELCIARGVEVSASLLRSSQSRISTSTMNHLRSSSAMFTTKQSDKPSSRPPSAGRKGPRYSDATTDQPPKEASAGTSAAIWQSNSAVTFSTQGAQQPTNPARVPSPTPVALLSGTMTYPVQQPLFGPNQPALGGSDPASAAGSKMRPLRRAPSGELRPLAPSLAPSQALPDQGNQQPDSEDSSAGMFSHVLRTPSAVSNSSASARAPSMANPLPEQTTLSAVPCSHALSSQGSSLTPSREPRSAQLHITPDAIIQLRQNCLSAASSPLSARDSAAVDEGVAHLREQLAMLIVGHDRKGAMRAVTDEAHKSMRPQREEMRAGADTRSEQRVAELDRLQSRIDTLRSSFTDAAKHMRRQRLVSREAAAPVTQDAVVEP